MKLKLTVFTTFVVCMWAISGAANTVVDMSGMVGSHKLVIRVAVVPSNYTVHIHSGTALVAITEVYPDSPVPVPYHYLVTGTGVETFERNYAARGFGPVTYFLETTGKDSSIEVHNLAGAEKPLRFLSIRGVSRKELERVRSRDKFTLMGTVINPVLGMAEDEQAARIAQRMPTDASSRIGRAMSYEILYASGNEQAVRAQLERAHAWSKKHGMKVLLGMVSWWNGTPTRVPDGLGGTFGDVKYQQICYTPDREHPENPELRALLGDRYNRHYRLSIPNIWSNTPWLTMNSQTLNEYRAKRMRDAARSLKEACGSDASWVAGIFMENEPRYWDTQSTEGTPQWAGPQWADFNPMTVQQAAQDGVVLDPSDGLSQKELAWLQMNVGRYFQQTVDAMNRALEEVKLRGKFPIYTHSLQIAALFPCSMINKTPADWAYASNSRTGIEGIWSNLSDFDRVREWGPWCNLNREETDPSPIETHLWDLRATFASGGEFFNSYNWHTLKDNAYFKYASEFLKGLPVVEMHPQHVNVVSPEVLEVTSPGSLQAYSVITVSIQPGSASAQTERVALEVDGATGRLWFSKRMADHGAGAGELAFTFPVPAEMAFGVKSIIKLHAYNSKGLEISDGATFGGNAEVSLRLDLQECRNRSLLVIDWKRAAAR